jgi:hypothetical protein
MSDEHAEPTPEAKFLTDLRDRVASGASVYGDPKSPRGAEKLAELDAKISLGRRLGEIAPAEEPWSEQRVAKERLAQEYPLGEPTAALPEHHRDFLSTQVDRLANLDGTALTRMADQVATECDDQVSRVSAPHSAYDRATGQKPGGHAIVRAMLADAEPIIAANVKPADQAAFRKALAADRKLLEIFAARGQEVAGYAARKKHYGQ